MVWGRPDWGCLLVMGLLLLAGWLAMGQPLQHPWLNWDSVVYLSGAASLVAGEGYRYVPFAGHPPIGFYPPGQSLFLAPFWALGSATYPDSYARLWAGQSLLLFAVCALGYGWSRQLGVSRIGALLLMLCFGWSPVAGWVQVHLYSDLGTAAMLLAALMWWGRRGAERLGDLLVIGVFLGFALLWRTAALPIWGMACLLVLVQGPGIRLGRSFAFAVPGLLAVALSKLNGSCGDSYGETIGRIYRAIIAEGGLGALYQLGIAHFFSGRPVTEAVFPVLNRLGSAAARWGAGASAIATGAEVAAAWAVLGASIWGLRRLPRSGRWILVACLVPYGLLLALLPLPPVDRSQARYLLIVSLVLVPGAVAWLEQLLRRPGLPRGSHILAWGTLSLLALQEMRATRGYLQAVSRAEAITDLRAFAAGLPGRLPPGSRLAATLAIPLVDLWRLTGLEFVADPDLPAMGPTHAAIGSPAFTHRLTFGPPWPEGTPVLASPGDHWRVYPARPR